MTQPFTILVVDDERSARAALSELLREEGFRVTEAEDGVKALHEIETMRPDVVLCDIRMPIMDGMTFLQKALAHDPELCIVLMTAYASVETAIEAMKLGAYHYLTKPLNFDEVMLQLSRCVERVQLQRAVREKPDESELVGTSKAFLECLSIVDQVAPAKSTVLLLGESGTGKELLAKRLHQRSSNRGPFMAINCAAIPTSILESELFGHEKGSFTGAHEKKVGVFEAASGGSLFLDEIGEISAELQVALLRVLQERTIKPVGGTRMVDIDVRIIAATNQDLRAQVDAGNFREDLFYRLNVIPIEVPPLRERPNDIPPLVRSFVAKYARENNKEVIGVTPEAMSLLESFPWPGNVRELENAIERAVVLCLNDTIDAVHLPTSIGKNSAVFNIPGATMDEIEHHAIIETYKACGGDTKKTAEVLQISRRKVQYRLREYRETFQES